MGRGVGHGRAVLDGDTVTGGTDVTEEAPLLELRGVSKVFGAVQALNG